MEKSCIYCGTQLEDEHKFCPYCGARVEEPMQETKRLCKTCGAKLTPDQLFCTACGVKIEDATNDELHGDMEEDKASETQQKELKKLTYWLIGSIIVVFAIIAIIVGINESDSSSSSSGSYSGSYGSSYGSSNYTPSYNTENASSALQFSDIRVEHNSLYTVCTGTIKNTGKKTYSYIQIKGAFKNSTGTVLDTAWTYAIGAEGLAPGESKTFRMSITKNTSVRSCSINIIS